MTYNTKLIAMFSPFVLFFAGLAILVQDMRHPVSSHDQCVVQATGADSNQFMAHSTILYRHSSNTLNNVSLRCNRLGSLFLNDAQLFLTPVKAGQGAHVRLKQYQFLPDRWLVDVVTGKSNGH